MRTCERTYNEQMIIEAGLRIVELEFPDGSNPPKAVIKQWLKMVQSQFGSPEELKKQW